MKHAIRHQARDPTRILPYLNSYLKSDSSFTDLDSSRANLDLPFISWIHLMPGFVLYKLEPSCIKPGSSYVKPGSSYVKQDSQQKL